MTDPPDNRDDRDRSPAIRPRLHRTCPSCGQGIDGSFDATRYDPFEILRCSRCDFSFVANPYSEDELKSFYKFDYGMSNSERYIAMERNNAAKNAAIVKTFISNSNFRRTNKSSLDIGAGAGFLVREMKGLGFGASGIELSDRSRAYARTELNVEVTDKSLDDLIAEGRKYDFITACEVIEHVVEPRQFLEKAKAILAGDGILMIKTDNFFSTVANIMGLHFYRTIPTQHISLFSPRTLRELAARCRLREIDSISWDPPFAVRWAIKHAVKKGLGVDMPLADPVAKATFGGDFSLLGRISDPLFAVLGLTFRRPGAGVEFASFFDAAP